VPDDERNCWAEELDDDDGVISSDEYEAVATVATFGCCFCCCG
jgi:hypothetical protein